MSEEFNIDFTTVGYPGKDENGALRRYELPPSGLEQGVLPKVIRTLVVREGGGSAPCLCLTVSDRLTFNRSGDET
jgi:hypothetical protein